MMMEERNMRHADNVNRKDGNDADDADNDDDADADDDNDADDADDADKESSDMTYSARADLFKGPHSYLSINMPEKSNHDHHESQSSRSSSWC